MNNKLLVTPTPHITKQSSTNILMFAMIAALVPTAVSGVITFGVRALYIILISIASSYLFDILFNYLKVKKFNFLDASSLVTGFVLALIMPVSIPLYVPIIASFIAIVIFKGCFGGIGKNIFNPSAAARVILGFIFAGLSVSMFSGIALSGAASPLSYYEVGDYSSITIHSLFFGTAPGAIGTVSMICILISGILLMCFRVTDFIIPVCSILTFIITTWIGQGAIAIVPYLFSGSFMFATMFMITDPTSSPNTVWGKLICGLFFGFIAGLFRVNFILGETSVFVAVLIVNLISPLLDKIFAPRPLGVRREN